VKVDLQEISKRYDSVTALSGVSLGIEEGEILGLVGPNGSGKTTLLKILMGLIRPTGGSVLLDGAVPGARQWRAFLRGVGYMPEHVLFYDRLTGRETLAFFAGLRAVPESRVETLLAQVGLGEAADRPVGEYSRGMRQRLNLAQALLHDPAFLILDEPTTGLDPLGIREFYEMLAALRARNGLSVLLSTHILAEIENRMDRVAILKAGTLQALGSLEDLHRKLRIPLRLRMRVSAGSHELETALAREGAARIRYRDGVLTAEIPFEQKVAVLAAVVGLAAGIEDFTLSEPSLEEVFFGVHGEGSDA
jgi:Cu-processing system ATP-binding protein